MDDREGGFGIEVRRRYHEDDAWRHVPIALIGEVTLEKNYSTAHAMLQETDGMGEYHLAKLFPDVIDDDKKLESVDDHPSGGEDQPKSEDIKADMDNELIGALFGDSALEDEQDPFHAAELCSTVVPQPRPNIPSMFAKSALKTDVIVKMEPPSMKKFGLIKMDLTDDDVAPKPAGDTALDVVTPAKKARRTEPLALERVADLMRSKKNSVALKRDVLSRDFGQAELLFAPPPPPSV
jgi:hypothetical protein